MRLVALVLLAGCGGAQSGSTEDDFVNYDCLDAIRAGTRTEAPFPRSGPPVELPAREVPSSLLEKNRIAGVRNVLPENATKDRMHTADVDQAKAVFKLCVDATGAPIHIDRLYSSCFPRYDNQLRGAMAAWRYTPYVENGQALAACTSVTFDYVAHGRR